MDAEPEWFTPNLLDEARVGLPAVPGFDARELVHEALLHILERPAGLARFGSAREFVAYLHRAARNVAIDHFRRAKRYARILTENGCTFGPVATEHPEERIYGAELRAFLRRLPSKERQAFAMRLRGYDNREIARWMEIGKNEPTKLHGRVRTKLQVHFGTSGLPDARRVTASMSSPDVINAIWWKRCVDASCLKARKPMIRMGWRVALRYYRAAHADSRAPR